MKNESALIPGTSAAAACLNALGAELARHRWVTRLDEPPARLPRLHIQHPDSPALSERVYAQPRRSGTWTYWWPWAQPIATTPAEAAAVIMHVLMSRRPSETARISSPSDQ